MVTTLSNAQRKALRGLAGFPEQYRAVGGWVNAGPSSIGSGPNWLTVSMATLASLEAKGLIERTPLAGSKSRLTAEGTAMCSGFDLEVK